MKTALALITLGLIGAGVWVAHPKGADTALIAPERPVAPPPQGALRLLVAGTSLTALTQWPEAVADSLQSCIGHTVTLQRVAEPGQTSQWGREAIGQGLSPAPDIALVEFTINDADIRRGVSLAQSLDNHRALITALRGANPDIHIVLLRLNRAYGLRAILRPRQAAYDRALVDLSRAEAVQLIDLRPLWAQAGRDVLADGIHPTPEAALRLNAPAITTGLAQHYGLGC